MVQGRCSYLCVVLFLLTVASGLEDATTEKEVPSPSVTGLDQPVHQRTCLDTLRIGYDSQLTTEHPVPIGSNCRDLCIGPDGKFAHPGDCRAYIQCQNWEAEAVLCPDFHYFDTTSRECVPAAMDDEARREQCRLRIFTTKSPTITDATLNTIEALSTTTSLMAVATAGPLILQEGDTDHSTRPPITPPEKYMKGVVLKIRPERPTQLTNLTSATETSPTTTAASPPNTIETKETIPQSTSTSTTEEPKAETSAMTSSTTHQSASEAPSTAPPITTEWTRRTTGRTVETTLRQVLLLAGSPFMNATASQLPVTATLKPSTAATAPPAAVYVEAVEPTPVTGKTTVMIAGKIPEFKRSRYYLPGTLYRPPVIQRPKTP